MVFRKTERLRESKPQSAVFRLLRHDKYQLAVRPEYPGKPWPEGPKIYTSMVTHLDDQVGELRRLLGERNLEVEFNYNVEFNYQ